MFLKVNVLSTDYASTSPLQVNVGGISIEDTSGVSESNQSPSTSFELEVFGRVELNINQPNFISYSTVIDDVGIENAEINIVLIEDFAEGDVNYMRPYPTFFSFRELGSFIYTFYSASSLVGHVSFGIEGGVIRGVKAIHHFETPGEYLVSITSVSDYYTETVPSNNNTNLSVTEYRAELGIKTESTLTYSEDGCYPDGAVINVTPTITLINPIDNSLYSSTLTVTNPKGFVVHEIHFLASAIPTDIYFEINEIGDYIINLYLEDNENQNTYEEDVAIKGCDSVVIEYNSCGSYSVFNYGNDELSIEIEADGINGTLVPREEFPIIPSEGIVQVVITYPDNTERVYLINNFCSIEKCMASYIEDILCAPRDRCRPCPPESELNQMFLFYNTYFMKVHALFYQNSYFDALSDENIADIVSIEALAAKMKAYCDNTEPGECCK